MKTLRIFVSSPGDVGKERVVAGLIIDRLQGEFRRRIKLDPYFWEHEPMRATTDYQGNIPKPSDFEIVICILWSRLGSPLNEKYRRADGSPYASGTEYEFEVATEARRLAGKPELLVYRNRQEPLIPMTPEVARDEKIRQFEALQRFLQRWFLNPDGTIRIASNNYDGLADFEERLGNDLRKLIGDMAPPLSGGAGEITGGTYAKGSPFRQLRPFEFDDAEIFFGRTKAIDDVLNALRDKATSGCGFTLIFGSSGSGKSSLARAGVLPMLVRPGVIEGIGLWRRTTLRPSDGAGDIFTGLASALMNETALPELATDAGASVADLAKSLRESPAGVPLLIRSALSQAARDLQAKEGLPAPPAVRLVVLVDQFEEIFTLADRFPSETRKRFVTALGELARCGSVWILATLRSEFFSRCEEIPELVALKDGKGQYQLLPPGASELRQIVRLPAFAAGLEFETDADGARLDDVLLDAAGRDPGALPLLEFALEELYKRRRDDRWLTHSAFKELKGIEGALETAAEDVFKQLPPDVSSQFEHVFRALVTTDLDDKKTLLRRIADLEALGSTPQRRRLIDAFVERRLLVTGVDAENHSVLQVAHESLFLHWPRLRALVESNREFLTRRARAGAALSLWQAQQRDSSYLWWHGKLLVEAKALLAHADDLRPAEREFAQVSVQAGRSAGRKRGVAAALAVIIALGAGISGYLWWQKSAADAKLTDLRQRLAAAPASDEDLIAYLSHEILRLSPADSEIWALYAAAFLEKNDSAGFDAALDQWQRNVSPRSPKIDDLLGDRALKQRNHQQAIEHWSAYLRNSSIDPQSRKATWTKLAAAHAALGQWIEARSYLTEWISVEDNVVARIRRAEAHRQLRDWGAAQRDLDRATELDPANPELKRVPPIVKPRGLDDLNERIRRSARDPALWSERATKLTLDRHFQAALEDVEKAQDLDPDSIRLLIDHAHLVWQLEQDVPEELGVRVSPNWTRDAAHFAAAFEAAQPDLNAVSALDARVKSDPSNVECYLERGDLLNRLNQPALAMRDFNRALEIDESSVPALEGRAASYRALDQIEAAEADLRRVQELRAAPSPPP